MYCCKWLLENASGEVSSILLPFWDFSCIQGDKGWMSVTSIIIPAFINGFALERKQDLSIIAYTCSNSWKKLRMDMYGMFSTSNVHAKGSSSGFFQKKVFKALAHGTYHALEDRHGLHTECSVYIGQPVLGDSN